MRGIEILKYFKNHLIMWGPLKYYEQNYYLILLPHNIENIFLSSYFQKIIRLIEKS